MRDQNAMIHNPWFSERDLNQLFEILGQFVPIKNLNSIIISYFLVGIKIEFISSDDHPFLSGIRATVIKSSASIGPLETILSRYKCNDGVALLHAEHINNFDADSDLLRNYYPYFATSVITANDRYVFLKSCIAAFYNVNTYLNPHLSQTSMLREEIMRSLQDFLELYIKPDGLNLEELKGFAFDQAERLVLWRQLFLFLYDIDFRDDVSKDMKENIATLLRHWGPPPAALRDEADETTLDYLQEVLYDNALLRPGQPHRWIRCLRLRFFLERLGLDLIKIRPFLPTGYSDNFFYLALYKDLLPHELFSATDQALNHDLLTLIIQCSGLDAVLYARYWTSFCFETTLFQYLEQHPLSDQKKYAWVRDRYIEGGVYLRGDILYQVLSKHTPLLSADEYCLNHNLKVPYSALSLWTKVFYGPRCSYDMLNEMFRDNTLVWFEELFVVPLRLLGSMLMLLRSVLELALLPLCALFYGGFSLKKQLLTVFSYQLDVVVSTLLIVSAVPFFLALFMCFTPIEIWEKKYDPPQNDLFRQWCDVLFLVLLSSPLLISGFALLLVSIPLIFLSFLLSFCAQWFSKCTIDSDQDLSNKVQSFGKSLPPAFNVYGVLSPLPTDEEQQLHGVRPG